MIRLLLLGPLALQRDDRPVDAHDLPRPKLVALIAYLSAAGDARPRSRDTLLAMLWPERDESTARQALRQSLFELRQALADDVLDGRRAEVVHLGPGLWTDVAAFRAALAAGRDDEALGLYRGELLAGFTLSGAPEFERWLANERRRLAEEAGRAAVRLGTAAAAAGDLAESVRWFARATEFTPYDELVWRRQIDALVRQGDRARALAVYRRFAELLTSDLGAEPGPELRQLIAGIRRPPEAPPAPGPATAVAADPGREFVTPPPAPSARSRRPVRLAPLLAVPVVGLVLLLAVRHAPPRAPLSLVVADFGSADGDASLTRAVRSALSVDLAQSPGVRVAGEALVREARRRMVRDSGPLDEATAREIALREGQSAIVTGEVRRVGAGYLLDARVEAARSADELSAARSSAKDSTELPGAIEDLSRALRRALGESRVSIRESGPLARVTTGSLEALQLYAAPDVDHGPPERAVANLRAAIALDSGFAMAWWRLATVYAAWGTTSEARAAAQRAYELRARLPEPERSLVEASHARTTGDPERARALLEALLALHPDEPEALTVLTDLLMRRGDWRNAERYAVRGRREVDRYNAFVVQAAQGYFAAAAKTLDSMASGGAEAFDDRLRGELAATRGDYAAAETSLWRSYHAAADSRGNRAGALGTLAQVAEAQGHVAAAIDLLERDVREAPALPPDVAIGRTLWIARLELQYRGDTAGALARVRGVLAAPAWRSLSAIDRPYVALAAGFSSTGRREEARRLLREQQVIVSDTNARAWRAAAAALAALDGDYAAAARRLTAVLATPWPECPSCGMYPVADAWDRAGLTDSALIWYLRALATPGSRRIAGDAPWRARALRRVVELARGTGRADLAARSQRELRRQWATADSSLVRPLWGGQVVVAAARHGR